MSIWFIAKGWYVQEICSISDWRKIVGFLLGDCKEPRQMERRRQYEKQDVAVSVCSQCHRFLKSRFWCMKRFLLGNSQYKDHQWDILYSEFFLFVYIIKAYLWKTVVFLFRVIESLGLEGTLKVISSECPAVDRIAIHFIRLPRAPASLALNTFRGGTSMASLDKIFCCLTTLSKTVSPSI